MVRLRPAIGGRAPVLIAGFEGSTLAIPDIIPRPIRTRPTKRPRRWKTGCIDVRGHNETLGDGRGRGSLRPHLDRTTTHHEQHRRDNHDHLFQTETRGRRGR